jgi:2-oxo-4-hydroxy-4-carboxy-5-ureidoimidazoline decarboxylase
MRIDDVNGMPEAAFVAAFGDVAEHSPWVARAAGLLRPFRDRDGMIAAFGAALRNAEVRDQLTLVRAHPDLAGMARLTSDSSREQKGAGLDSLTPAEMQRFTALNDAYKARFGFPFILAVRGATKYQILSAFEARVEHDTESEFETAIAQVARIVAFRIEDRVAP